MAYRMEYEPANHQMNSRRRARRIALTAICFCIFCQLVSSFWPEGMELMKILLIPGDPDATLEAAEVFAGEIACGIPLHHAAENFCLTVLQHGYPG